MSGRKTIGFSFNVELPTQVIATPTVRSVVNNFDYIGDQVSLIRLPGESNVDYRNRLWDVSVHQSGPNYEGVINSLGRDLGMLRQLTMTIELNLDSAGTPIAPNPRVDILANRIILYSDWRPNGTAVIDRTIRFFQIDDTGYYLNDLISAINESTYFTATLESGIRPNLHSFTLVRETSNIVVIENNIRADKLTELDYDYIIQDSLAFTEKGTFDTEVSGSPSQDGEYTVDYVNGNVEVYTMPSGTGSCSYQANIFPVKVDSIPMQIFSLQDDDFQSELYNKRTLDSGEEVNALLNAEGAEIYHQLFMNTKVFWGN